MLVHDGANVTADQVLVTDTAALADGSYGDGITVFDAALTLTHSRIARSARAGVASFAGKVSFVGVVVDCAAFALDGEPDPPEPADYSFDLTGGAVCGCGTSEGPCQVLSSSLAPPSSLDPSK